MRTLRPSLRAGSWRLLACVTLLTGACSHNTHYKPKANGKPHLLIHNGQLLVEHGHGRMPVKSVNPDTFSCHDDAFASAMSASEEMKVAKGASETASALNMVVALVPVLAFVSIAFSVSAANHEAAGMARLVDAMNQYQDATSCAKAGNS